MKESLKVPPGYEAYKKKVLKRKKFEEATEDKTKRYIA